jgi:hypothetical protein
MGALRGRTLFRGFTAIRDTAAEGVVTGPLVQERLKHFLALRSVEQLIIRNGVAAELLCLLNIQLICHLVLRCFMFFIKLR